MNPVSRIRQITQIHLPVLAASLLYVSWASAQSAAEADWQINAEAGQCRGTYAEDTSIAKTSPADPNTIEAIADSILHVEEHSTSGDAVVHGEVLEPTARRDLL